jgi:protein AFG1
MKALRTVLASSHPRPSPTRCARFYTAAVPRAPRRAQNSSLASLSAGPSSAQGLDPDLFARVPDVANTQRTYAPPPPINGQGPTYHF